MNDPTGLVNEDRLVELVEGERESMSGGWTPTVSSVVCGAIIVATYAAGFCPTSGCTVRCGK